MRKRSVWLHPSKPAKEDDLKSDINWSQSDPSENFKCLGFPRVICHCVMLQSDLLPLPLKTIKLTIWRLESRADVINIFFIHTSCFACKRSQVRSLAVPVRAVKNPWLKPYGDAAGQAILSCMDDSPGSGEDSFIWSTGSGNLWIGPCITTSTWETATNASPWQLEQ